MISTRKSPVKSSCKLVKEGPPLEKSTSFLWIMRQVQAKFLYYLGLVSSALSAFLLNLVMATFFLNMLTQAEERNLKSLLSHLQSTIFQLLTLILVIMIADYFFHYGVTKTTAYIRARMFSHIQKLPTRYHEKHHSGDLISRATHDIKTLEQVYSTTLRSILTSGLGGVLALIVMFRLNFPLALYVVLMGGLITLLNTRFLEPLRKTGDAVQEALSRVTKGLSNVLASAKVTRIFSLESHINNQYRKENQRLFQLTQKRVVQNALMNSLNFATSFLSFFGMVILGGFLVFWGRATLAQLIFMVQMQNSVNQLFYVLGDQITQLQTALAGAGRVEELLCEKLEPPLYRLPKESKRAPLEGIFVEGITFSYEEGTPVLQNVSFYVPRGRTYALVGKSGSGKTTIFKLLLGFYPIKEGRLAIEGHPLEETPLTKLRDLLAYVPQDTHLFSGTIRENIAFGNIKATEQEILKASKAAYAHSFIEKLPKGYDTLVGEQGSHLSGGQKQCISIARAILKNAPILLLDEATSALDTESATLVKKALSRLMKGRTVLMIAHQLSTIEEADSILVMDKGTIVERGTHKELSRNRNSVYATIHNLPYASLAEEA